MATAAATSAAASASPSSAAVSNASSTARTGGAVAAAPTSEPSILPPFPRFRTHKRKRPFPRERKLAPLVAEHTITKSDARPPGSMRARVDVAPPMDEGSVPESGSGSSDDMSVARGRRTGVTAGVRFTDSSSATSGASSDEASRSGSESDNGAPLSRTSAVDAEAAARRPRADIPAADLKFAVVRLGGTQYKVTVGDVINAERIPNAEVGSTFVLDRVHVVGSATKTVFGRPEVPGVQVVAAVEEQTSASKVVVYKKKRRKRYQRTKGHRRLVTVLRVNDIVCNLDAF